MHAPRRSLFYNTAVSARALLPLNARAHAAPRYISARALGSMSRKHACRHRVARSRHRVCLNVARRKTPRQRLLLSPYHHV